MGQETLATIVGVLRQGSSSQVEPTVPNLPCCMAAKGIWAMLNTMRRVWTIKKNEREGGRKNMMSYKAVRLPSTT